MKRAIAMHRAQRARSTGLDETGKPTERVGLVQHWGGALPPSPTGTGVHLGGCFGKALSTFGMSNCKELKRGRILVFFWDLNAT